VRLHAESLVENLNNGRVMHAPRKFLWGDITTIVDVEFLEDGCQPLQFPFFYRLLIGSANGNLEWFTLKGFLWDTAALQEFDALFEAT